MLGNYGIFDRGAMVVMASKNKVPRKSGRYDFPHLTHSTQLTINHLKLYLILLQAIEKRMHKGM